MATFGGKEYTREQLLEYVGSMDQIAPIEAKTYIDGKAKGVRTVELDNGSGLSLEVLVDRCLDLGGRPLLRPVPQLVVGGGSNPPRLL